MKFDVVIGDITKFEADAIVNAANRTLLGGGGVDGAIHRAAGPELLTECRTLGGCETGEAKITGGYRLPASFVIHTPGPVYRSYKPEVAARLLRNCYENSLKIAEERGLKTVGFSSISTGIYAFPLSDAARIVAETFRDFASQAKSVERATMVCFDETTADAYRRAFAALEN